MNKFLIIALNVYKKQVRSGAFLVMILAPLVMFAIYYGMGKFIDSSNEISTVAVYADQPTIAQSVQKLPDYKVKIVPSIEKGKQALADEKVDLLLTIHNQENNLSAKILSRGQMDTTFEFQLKELLNQMQSQLKATSLGLTSEQFAQLKVQVPLTIQRVQLNDQGKLVIKHEDGKIVQMIIAFVCTILLFIFVMNYASVIAQEIATEKGSRIMEIILSSTKATTHYYGKIFGVLLVGLTQMIIYIPIILAALYVAKDNATLKPFLSGLSVGNSFNINIIWNTLLIVLFIISGILQYAVLSALAGSLVNRAEETSKAIMPVTYLALIGYLGGIAFSVTNIQNPILKVTSYIPFWSAFGMPIRIVNEVVSYPLALVSLVLNILVTFIVMRISSRMYKANVLIYDDKGVLSALKQSFKLMKTVK